MPLTQTNNFHISWGSLFFVCVKRFYIAFSVFFCERRNWRPFWYNTALSKWESPHFFARFKFRKLHANVFKSAAILPRNGQFVLTTSTNDRTVNQSIPRWCYYTPRSIPMTIFSPFEILSYWREDNTLYNFPSIFEPALKIVLKVITRPDQFQWRFFARLRSWVIGARTILFAIFPQFLSQH